MTRLGAWARAQRLFGWRKGALRTSASAQTRCQVGYMEFDPVLDSDGDGPSLFVMVGWGPTWEAAIAHARIQSKEWKEVGWWPDHLRR